jgi:hypothetical protein
MLCRCSKGYNRGATRDIRRQVKRDLTNVDSVMVEMVGFTNSAGGVNYSV